MAILSCKNRTIAPSANLDKIDSSFELEKTPNLKIVSNSKVSFKNQDSKFVVLKNSFGFGGTNGSIVIASYKPKLT